MKVYDWYFCYDGRRLVGMPEWGKFGGGKSEFVELDDFDSIQILKPRGHNYRPEDDLDNIVSLKKKKW